MNGSLAMRSTRLRTLLLALVGGGMLLSVYLLTSSQYHLKDARNSLEACLQQKDSLLAQLQVVYEQESRMEKTLQQEKLDHKKTQDENQRNNYLRLQVQKAKVDVDTKLSALQKEQQTLQERYHELESQTTELKEQQTQNEENLIKKETEYKNNIKMKEEENTLLHGNLSLVLKERDAFESQNVRLTNKIQQSKADLLHYKNKYLEMESRLKKEMLLHKAQDPSKDLTKAQLNELPDVGGSVTKKSEPANDVLEESNKGVIGNTPLSNDVHNNENQFQAHDSNFQAGNNDLYHDNQQQQIQPAKIAGIPKPGREAAPELPREEEEGIGAGNGAGKNPDPNSHLDVPNEGVVAHANQNFNLPKGAEGGGHPVVGLREQLQPPDYAKHEQNQAAESSSVSSSSPGQVGAGNQPLLPPPPPQDGKQGEAAPIPQIPQSLEQRDQDTMARKPNFESNHMIQDLGPNNEMRNHENMFIGGGGAPWNQLGDMGAPIGQQQIRSPDIKSKANNNNGGRPEEEDNYPEDGDDDNAEEQDETRDKHAKAFADHDFEDNDGNEHNHAKEEGIVVAPK